MSCLICGSVEDVEDHHLMPRIWKKEQNEETIPLCHHHHTFMPPFVVYASRPNAEKIMRHMVFVLNKKVSKYRWSVEIAKRCKNGNYLLVIMMGKNFCPTTLFSVKREPLQPIKRVTLSL